jgi:hypothetical protein
MGWHKSAAVRYFGVFLTTAGANSNVPATMSYQANNIRGQWKRAFCSATLVGFGGIGGIAGSLVFRLQDAPTYYPGLYACIATSLLNIIIVALLTLTFWRQNRKAERGEIELEDSDVSVSTILQRKLLTICRRIIRRDSDIPIKCTASFQHASRFNHVVHHFGPIIALVNLSLGWSLVDWI